MKSHQSYERWSFFLFLVKHIYQGEHIPRASTRKVKKYSNSKE